MDWTWEDLMKVIVGAGGAYAGWQAGGDNSTTSTTQMSPEMQGQWNAYRDLANQVAARPYMNTVAPFSQDQYGAMDMIRNAAGGTPETQAGSNALQGFLSNGQQNPYMGDNPYLEGLIDRTSDSIQNRMGSAAFSSGSFGNSGVASQTANALADSENALRYQNYNQSAQLGENALNRTASMIPMALQYGQMPMNNASALMTSGSMQQQQGQNVMNNWWNYPMQQMQAMGSPLNLGQGSSTTTTQQGNPWASALGGGLLGYQFGKTF